MKFILTIILSVLIFSIGEGQIIRQNLGGSPKVRSYLQGTIEGDSGIVLRTVSDTALLNIGNFSKKVNSLLVRVGDKLYFRDTATKKWITTVSTLDIIKVFNDSTRYIKGRYPVVITAINDSTYQWSLKQSFIDSALALDILPTFITKSQADSISNISAFIVGNFYGITNVHPSLYGGTTIILQAIKTDKLSNGGNGIFYNPAYSRLAVCDTSLTYNAGDTAVWGGYVWVCNTTGKPAATDILNLNGSWTKVAYDTLAYKIAVDAIEYDYANDLIVSRYDAIADNIVTATKADVDFWVIEYGFTYHPIAVFQWGNTFDYYTGLGVGKNKVYNSYFECVNQVNSGIYYNSMTASSYINSNTITGSYISYITMTGSSITNITMTGSSITNITMTGSYISSNTMTSSYITNNTMTSSYISYITMTSSTIYSNTMTSSYISYITMTSSTIYSNTMTGSQINLATSGTLTSKTIQNLTMEAATLSANISAATIIYLPVQKKIFTMPNGTVKIQYINNDNVTVTADSNY